jgi:Zn-dependent metalloprotease
MTCSIIPPYLLRRIASLDDPRFSRAIVAAQSSLALDRPYTPGFRSGEPVPPTTVLPGREGREGLTARSIGDVRRTVSDARNTEELPGILVRSNGDGHSDDEAVNEAWNGLGLTHDFFRSAFNRASIDNANSRLDATVHFGIDYDNAFWNGERMVFGDGDGEIFRRMTASLSVIGHELAHGVTQYTAGLDYEGQSGALNESISDVFGALVEQHSMEQSAEEASWLIGLGLFTDAVEGEAIRSMKAPGTAYDDDVLGRDPQPDHMDSYVETRDDNGGVHLNSGIPNRAFFLAATDIGGFAWEGAGLVWYDAITTGSLAQTARFTDFAAVTTDAAAARFGDGSRQHESVASAWRTVGVTS